jgi:hypothetical protein
MTPPKGFTRPHTKCQRGKGNAIPCGERYEHHINGACPDGRGTFIKNVQTNRASASFSAEEVALLDDIRKGLTVRHRDLSHLTRHPAFASLALKVQTMNHAIQSAPSSRAASSSPGNAAHTQSGNGADPSGKHLGS